MAFLTEGTSALLADEMGLGKTIQVAVALDVLRRSGRLRQALVVAPAALLENWRRELAEWSPLLTTLRLRGTQRERIVALDLPVHVMLMSYESLRADFRRTPQRIRYSVVVLDEAQRIKNRHSLIALVVRSLKRERSWALTGTPLENRADELLSVMGFVSPTKLRPGMRLRELHEVLEPVFLRRRKVEVARELPPVIDQELPIIMSPRQRRAYDRILTGTGAVAEASAASILALITRLKQCCNYDRDTGESAKLDALNLLLESAPDGKFLVFSQYVQTLSWLSERLGTLPHVMYHGGLSPAAREDSIGRFQNGSAPIVMLTSLGAGGVGLNLQAATHVVLFDRWWNPAVEAQAVGRAHRIGREGPLHAIRFVTVDSIEERIQEVLQEKADLFKSVVEGAPSARLDSHIIAALRRVLAAPSGKEELSVGRIG